MAELTNTYKTDTAVEEREDLSNIVYNIDRDDTPLISSIPRVNATGVKHEWHTQDLPSTTVSFVAEGNEFSASATTAPTRLANYCGIQQQAYTISDTMQAVDVAGDTVTVREQIRNAKALRIKTEKALLDNNAYVTSGTREIAGLPTYLTTNISKASDGSNAGGTGADARTDGALRSFSEDLLLDVMQSLGENSAQQGGEYMALANPAKRRDLSSIVTGSNTRQIDVADGMIQQSIDVINTDFGVVEIAHTPNVRAVNTTGSEIFVLRKDMLAFAVLRDFGERALGRRGDGDDFLQNVEATLEVRNEKAHGLITDLS